MSEIWSSPHGERRELLLEGRTRNCKYRVKIPWLGYITGNFPSRYFSLSFLPTDSPPHHQPTPPPTLPPLLLQKQQREDVPGSDSLGPMYTFNAELPSAFTGAQNEFNVAITWVRADRFRCGGSIVSTVISACGRTNLIASLPSVFITVGRVCSDRCDFVAMRKSDLGMCPACIVPHLIQTCGGGGGF